MWPFKKKVIDLTSNRIKVPESVRTKLEGYADLTSSGNQSQVNESASQQDSSFNFLGNLASSASPTENSDLNLKHLKVKLEDIEYKIENLMRKFSSLIDRVDLAEKKIDRIERRGS